MHSIPILSGAVAAYWGWRYGMIVPGIIACVIGFALCFLLRDRLTSMGLPTVGEWRIDIAEKEHESEGLGLSNWKFLKFMCLKQQYLGISIFLGVLFISSVPVSMTGVTYI